MDETRLYDELARHLDQGIMGSPKSPALMDILRILFPPEEAEIALRLPMQNKSLSELKQVFVERTDSLGPTLDRMAQRGTVYRGQRAGEEAKYRLLPSVVGWAETPFWAGKDTEAARKLAPLWLKYRDEAFGAELARGGMPVMRVIPVSKTLTASSEVLPFEALRPKVEAQSFFAVAHCPCRQMKRYVGQGCFHSLENCLHFGAMGRYMVEQRMAREITQEETLRILKEANEEGLVHAAENMEGHLGTICNCCGCCCVFLETKRRTGLHTISSSNYVASVDGDRCVACGTCEERCPMGAIAVGSGDVAAVEEARCIGCGVCTPTCPGEAVELGLRSEIKPPPGLQEFLAKRWKAL
jgi:NAD-dependent dihydropyrimidine dehydrogenase PreA subunit